MEWCWLCVRLKPACTQLSDVRFVKMHAVSFLGGGLESAFVSRERETGLFSCPFFICSKRILSPSQSFLHFHSLWDHRPHKHRFTHPDQSHDTTHRLLFARVKAGGYSEDLGIDTSMVVSPTLRSIYIPSLPFSAPPGAPSCQEKTAKSWLVLHFFHWLNHLFLLSLSRCVFLSQVGTAGGGVKEESWNRQRPDGDLTDWPSGDPSRRPHLVTRLQRLTLSKQPKPGLRKHRLRSGVLPLSPVLIAETGL